MAQCYYSTVAAEWAPLLAHALLMRSELLHAGRPVICVAASWHDVAPLLLLRCVWLQHGNMSRPKLYREDDWKKAYVTFVPPEGVTLPSPPRCCRVSCDHTHLMISSHSFVHLQCSRLCAQTAAGLLPLMA